MPNAPIGKNVGNVTLALGLAQVRGGTWTIRNTANEKQTEMHSVCPSCTKPVEFMAARLVCKEDPTHGPFKKEDIKKGKLVGDKIVVVSQEDIDEAKASVLPPAVLDLQVHDRADVKAHTFPAGNAYVFMPETGYEKQYTLLLELLRARPDLCLLAKTNLRKADHLMMVDVELNGQLVLREMMWPEDMKAFDTPVMATLTEREMKLGLDLFKGLYSEFDASEYRTDSRARISELVVAAAAAPKKRGKKPVPAPAVDNSLEQLLAASMTAKKRKAS